MGALIRFFKKLSLLFTRGRFHSELDEEMAFHREQQEQAYELHGDIPLLNYPSAGFVGEMTNSAPGGKTTATSSKPLRGGS